MKKLLIFLAVFIILPSPVHAVVATPSSQASNSAQVKEESKTSTDSAKDLVNKITDKVSQMGQNFKKTYSGKIRSLGNNSISLTHDQGEIFVETNEATNFYKVRTGTRTSTDFKALKIGNEITVFGIYDDGAKTLVARTLIDKIRRHAIFGKVTDITKDLYTLSQPDGTSKIADLTDTTAFKKITPKQVLSTAKQAEITLGDYISVIGFYEDGKTNLSGLKVLIIPQITSDGSTASPSAKPAN